MLARMSLQHKIRLFACFRFFTAFRFSSAILIIYFARVSGSYALGMSVFSVVSLSQLVFDIPTGALSDMIGRKQILFAGSIVALCYTACYAASNSYWLLAAGAAFEGLDRALNSGTWNALLFETLAEHDSIGRYAEFSGKLTAAEHTAFGLSGLAGGIIAAYSFHLVFWLTLVPQAVALVLTLCLHEPARSSRRRRSLRAGLLETMRQFGANGRLRLLTLAAALGETIGETAFQFRPAFFLTVWPVWALGMTGTITQFGGAASFYFAGRIIRRFEALRVLVGEVISSRVLNVTALLFPGSASPLLMSFTSLTYGPVQVATETLLQHEFTDEQRATMGSVVSQASNIGFAIGAVLLGLCADRIGPVRTLLFIQLLALLPLWVYHRLFASHPGVASV